MYKLIIRPILFRIDPEKVHHIIVRFVQLGFCIPGVPQLIKRIYTLEHPKLKRTVFGLTFKNPVGLAAGFDKNASFYNQFANFGFSFIEIGTVTPKAQPGNPKPRLFRFPSDSAIINRMGFNNHGVRKTVQNLKKRKTKIIIGGNIGKNTTTPNNLAVDDYINTFNELYYYVDYLVVNVSCPNISDLHELQNKDSLTEILTRLLKEREDKTMAKPVLLKISPDLNFNQIDEVIEMVNEIKIDGLVVSNTTTGRYDLSTPTDKINAIGNGGMSGKPLRKRSTEMIRYIHQKTNGSIPIIGVGGIMTPEDALEKLNAGASLVQIYSGFIYEGPAIVKRINKAVLSLSER
jgi:dihydroorotate dehydrogenase